mmetsp:Transcript_27891/g.36287  ORF Transcript_27891/g.36287 Transcript_27891/m.36287 type:complete len:80 (-) Transcript_27891:1358-1597(-)
MVEKVWAHIPDIYLNTDSHPSSQSRNVFLKKKCVKGLYEFLLPATVLLFLVCFCQLSIPIWLPNFGARFFYRSNDFKKI